MFLAVDNEPGYAIIRRTLYLGSLKSDVYFCIYEKDYEQYVKLGTPLDEADIINRFEIRLRNERAYYAVRDLLTYYDAEQTAFSIINQYVRFVDEEPDKRKNDWKLNERYPELDNCFFMAMEDNVDMRFNDVQFRCV